MVIKQIEKLPVSVNAEEFQKVIRKLSDAKLGRFFTVFCMEDQKKLTNEEIKEALGNYSFEEYKKFTKDGFLNWYE